MNITALMLNGVICECCGDYVGKACGYPRKCPPCNRPELFKEWKLVEAEKIEQLEDKGYSIKKIKNYHYRINDKLDVWPTKNRYHYIPSDRAGKYLSVEGLLKMFENKLNGNRGRFFKG